MIIIVGRSLSNVLLLSKGELLNIFFICSSVISLVLIPTFEALRAATITASAHMLPIIFTVEQFIALKDGNLPDGEKCS